MNTSVERGQVRIDIQDTGRGMSAEEQRHAFDALYRAQPCIEESGCGLGLTIAQTLVEMHGGSISVTSAPGQGSTFSVSLPY